MAIMARKWRGLPSLWVVNVAFAAIMLAAGILVDGNGRLPGLNETSSRAVTIAIVVLGLGTDGLVAFLDKSMEGASDNDWDRSSLPIDVCSLLG